MVGQVRQDRRWLLAGAAVSVLGVLAGTPALAQQSIGGTPVDQLVVIKPPATDDYKNEAVSIVKLPEPILDTPQAIDTVSRQVMDDQASMNLSDVFRNASGISLGAGKSSWSGTNLTLRGFNARNDMYLDGMRDFGSYYRDPFNLEEVEVLEGPSSILFGRGSTGGVVNQVSKVPTLDPHVRADLTAGTDDTLRVTADINEVLPELGQGAAFRLTAMGDNSGVAGRSEAKYRRYGVAPSLSLGLGTPTRMTFSWFHQSENDVPDYGIPWLLGKPAPVPRDSFYGFKSDFLNADTDAVTGKLEHDFSDHATIRTQIRYANSTRDWRDTEPQPSAATAATPLSSITVNRAEQSGHDHDTFLQDQTDLTVKFATGAIQHTLVTGIEFGPESSKPEYDNTTGVPSTPLLTPNPNQLFAGTNYPRAVVSTTAFTTSAYAMDTMTIGSHWLITGGIRYDDFNSNYNASFFSVPPAALGVVTGTAHDKRDDAEPSYRGSIVYKPTENGSIYFDYSTSFDPSAEALSEIVAVRSFNQGNVNLDPEKNRVFEVGTKWELLNQRLLLTVDGFSEQKYNARIPDPANPGFNLLGGDQEVNGAEVELVGRLTDLWQLTASYTYMDSKVTKSGPGGPAVGTALFNAPKDSFSMWTTYALPHGFQIGGGMDYVSSRLGSITNPIETAPGYTTFDAMIKYQINKRMTVQLNGYNLTDKYYADELHGFHIIPGPGRSALLTLGLAF